MEQLFKDENVDAVLLVLPIPLMADAVEGALRAGKHVISGAHSTLCAVASTVAYEIEGALRMRGGACGAERVCRHREVAWRAPHMNMGVLPIRAGGVSAT